MGLLAFVISSIDMISERERRITSICVGLFVVLVFTIEYLYVVSIWRRPEFGYRAMMATLFVFTTLSEVETALGEGFLIHVPRASVVALAVNSAILEGVMLGKRRAFARKMRVYDEQMLAEDVFGDEA